MRILYWHTSDGGTLCDEHGEAYAAEYAAEHGVDADEQPWPVMDYEDTSGSESVHLCDVQGCGAFCASCGTGLDSSDSDSRTPWWECWSCRTVHCYVDGFGYCLADDDRARLTVGWTHNANRVIPLQYRVPTPRLLDTAGIEYLTIDAVLDAGAGDALRVITYGPFGNAVLVAGGSEDDALEARDEWLIERWDDEQDALAPEWRDETDPWDSETNPDGHPALLCDYAPVRVFLVGAGERDALAYSGTERTIPRAGVHTSI